MHEKISGSEKDFFSRLWGREKISKGAKKYLRGVKKYLEGVKNICDHFFIFFIFFQKIFVTKFFNASEETNSSPPETLSPFLRLSLSLSTPEAF